MSNSEEFETSEVIKCFEQFIEDTPYKDIMRLRLATLNKNHIVVDFKDLQTYYPFIAELLLNNPEETIDCFRVAIKRTFDLKCSIDEINIRFRNVCKSSYYDVNSLRGSKHIGKMLSVVGTIKTKSQIKTAVKELVFECPSCAQLIKITQDTKKVKMPKGCTTPRCGRKTGFKVVKERYIDKIYVVLEELTEIAEEELKEVYVLIQGDLLDQHLECKIILGKKIRVNGIMKSLMDEKTELDVYIDANYIEFVDEEFTFIKPLTHEEEQQIKKLAAKPDLLDYLANDIYSGIYGYSEIKKALVLQLFGGKRNIKNNVSTRGDIHILLIGDTSTAKSTFLKITQTVSPKAKYAAGKGLSTAGLLGAPVRDEKIGSWTIVAGVFPLCHRGILCLDELDKVHETVIQGLHESLEQQEVNISKISKITLKAETALLAAANPKYGRFVIEEEMYKQINLPPTLVSRFDLKFPIQDKPDKEKDKNIASMIVDRFVSTDKISMGLTPEFIKKYLLYAKKYIPSTSDSVKQYLIDQYCLLRDMKTDGNGFRLTADTRVLESAIRLSCASARMHLRDVNIEDVKQAYGLIMFSLQQLCYDAATNTFDLDKITTGIASSTRKKIIDIKQVVRDIETQISPAPVQDIIDKCVELKLGTIDEIEELLNKLTHEGEYYEPRKGFLKLVM